jgi:ABC-type phosphate transport system substrate-binding protein
VRSIGVEGNPGVAEAVAHIPFSVAYIERSYPNGPALFDAAIRNQAGNYVTPTAADAGPEIRHHADRQRRLHLIAVDVSAKALQAAR